MKCCKNRGRSRGPGARRLLRQLDNAPALAVVCRGEGANAHSLIPAAWVHNPSRTLVLQKGRPPVQRGCTDRVGWVGLGARRAQTPRVAAKQWLPTTAVECDPFSAQVLGGCWSTPSWSEQSVMSNSTRHTPKRWGRERNPKVTWKPNTGVFSGENGLGQAVRPYVLIVRAPRSAKALGGRGCASRRAPRAVGQGVAREAAPEWAGHQHGKVASGLHEMGRLLRGRVPGGEVRSRARLCAAGALRKLTHPPGAARAVASAPRRCRAPRPRRPQRWRLAGVRW